MALRTQLALQRQLKRERAHLQWLEQLATVCTVGAL